MVQLSEKLIPFCGLEPAWQPLTAQLVCIMELTAVNKVPGVPEQVPGFVGLLFDPPSEFLLHEIKTIKTPIKKAVFFFFIATL